ncbi:TetR family transcriptional regulator [Nocardioides sp. AE5]|uniref:TetR family transcriptional regulator n=1 Tax=Nocardioides sp. AE5 TaxID=2962573 RepID=UPI00288233FC|nr:TetR family transcriptional regulator [Nocardioides sp. AE5]MDT0201865.1 TetR family transcriptional regulator [Nocardioides sp. AE5]
MSIEGVAGESRAERKERTRRAILDAALDQLAETSFDSLSLRQLAKAVGIVPTGFYRHFATLEELGLALVEESFGTLRELIREVRRSDLVPDLLIDRSVEVLAEQLDAHTAHYRFIARERYGGSAVIRDAIRHELGLFERELVTDLARMPEIAHWGAADLHVLASLFVDLMVSASGELVGPRAEQPGRRREVIETLRNQGRMIVVGAAGWQPLSS